MKNLLIFISLALATVALAEIRPESAAQRVARENAEVAWANIVSRRYDLDALHQFLKVTIAETKNWGSVDLTKSHLKRGWSFTGQAMECGHWSFSTPDPKKDEFALRLFVGDHSIVLKCVRQDRKSFKVAEITREETLLIVF